MLSLDMTKTGRIAIAAGIVGVFGSATFLGFLFAGSFLSGVLADWIGILSGLLFILLSIGLGNLTVPQNHNIGRAIQILGVLSGALGVINLALIITQLRAFQEASDMGYIGSILIGVVVILFVFTNRSALNFGRAYLVFSLIYGVAMLLNILTFVFEDQFLQLLEGSAGLGDISPVFLVLLFTFAPFSILGPPIWLLWTGRVLLKQGRQKAPELQTS